MRFSITIDTLEFPQNTYRPNLDLLSNVMISTLVEKKCWFKSEFESG